MIITDAISFDAVEYVAEPVLVPNIPVLFILKIISGDLIAIDDRYINNYTV